MTKENVMKKYKWKFPVLEDGVKAKRYFINSSGEIKIRFVNKCQPYRDLGTFLKGRFNGRVQVWITLDSKEKPRAYYLHRLVWQTFVGLIPKGYVIHHKDGNTRNNELSNLKIMKHEEHSKFHNTGSGNGMFEKKASEETIRKMKKSQRKRRKNNPVSEETRKKLRGENSSSAILTERQVLEIREEYSNGLISQRELARKYSVSRGCIVGILNRKTWKHLP